MKRIELEKELLDKMVLLERVQDKEIIKKLKKEIRDIQEKLNEQEVGIQLLNG